MTTVMSAKHWSKGEIAAQFAAVARALSFAGHTLIGHLSPKEHAVLRELEHLPSGS